MRRAAVAAAVVGYFLLLNACDDGLSRPSDISVGGSVSGLAIGAKLVLEDNGTDSLTLSANGSFAFATPINYNGTYAVTVVTQPTGATCTVSNGIGAGVTAAITNVTVACSTKTFPVSGTLSGLPAGTRLVLQNNGADALGLSANGAFKFTTPLAYDGSYTVTVSAQPAEATCSVTHGIGAGITAAVAGVSVICSLDTYTIAGTVTGLATGSQVTLDDNATDALTVTANGVFTFATPVAAGGSYTVTVGTQPTGKTCTVTGSHGSHLAGNVSGVIVTCSASTFTIGGVLSGLAGDVQVTLDNNGANPLTLHANGAFTFTTPVAYGSTYSVTVATPPNGALCGITNAGGPNVASNITNVSVSCSPSISYTTPGSFTWTVPTGVTSVQVVVIGGGGGGSGILSYTGVGQSGGSGAEVTATLSVTLGQVIGLVVGGGGAEGPNYPYGVSVGGGGGGASSIDVGYPDQVIAGGGGGGGGSCVSTGGDGGSGGGAGGAGGAGDANGGAGGSGGIGGPAGSFYGSVAGGNGSGGAGGAGGGFGGGTLGGAGGSGVGTGVGASAQLIAGGGGGGYGGGASGPFGGGGGGAGGSTSPSGTGYSAASNAGAPAVSGGNGSITITMQ